MNTVKVIELIKSLDICDEGSDTIKEIVEEITGEKFKEEKQKIYHIGQVFKKGDKSYLVCNGWGNVGETFVVCIQTGETEHWLGAGTIEDKNNIKESKMDVLFDGDFDKYELLS